MSFENCDRIVFEVDLVTNMGSSQLIVEGFFDNVDVGLSE